MKFTEMIKIIINWFKGLFKKKDKQAEYSAGNLNSESGLSDADIRKRNMEHFKTIDLPELLKERASMVLPPDFSEMSDVEKEVILKSMKKG